MGYNCGKVMGNNTAVPKFYAYIYIFNLDYRFISYAKLIQIALTKLSVTFTKQCYLISTQDLIPARN